MKPHNDITASSAIWIDPVEDVPYLWTSRIMANEARKALAAHGITAYFARVESYAWGLSEKKDGEGRMVGQTAVETNPIFGDFS